MKFQKYLREVESTGPRGLINLNYKILKAELKELRAEVEAGLLPASDAVPRFAARLRAEIQVVGEHWAHHVRLLAEKAEDLFSAAGTLLSGDFAYEALCEALRPVTLLEPLQPWLELASWADALRRHRLLQAAAVVKIEKKFVKTMCGCRQGIGCKGVDAAAMLRESALGGDALHVVCRQLEAAGDALLHLGLGAACGPGAAGPCTICLCDVTDPVRLPCGHRFCVHCVLPMFEAREDSGAEAESDAALMRCPLCRAAGPAAPQALALDGLLPRMERGLGSNCEKISAKEEEWRLTAVVVSSLARLASPAAAAGSRSRADAAELLRCSKVHQEEVSCTDLATPEYCCQQVLPKAAGCTPSGQ